MRFRCQSRKRRQAANLLAMSVTIAVMTGVALAVVALFWSEEIGILLRQPALAPYLWMLPVGVFLSGAYSALQFWSARKRAFSAIAYSRIAQSGCSVGTQVGLGTLGLAPFGLLLGQLISSGAGVIGLMGRLLRQERQVLSDVTWAEMRAVIRRHDKFAKYVMPELLANSAGVQLPMMIIAAISAGPEAGFLMLAMRVMQAPLALVGSAVSQVYYVQAPRAFRGGTLTTLSADILDKLAKIGIGPLFFVAIVAPDVFAIAFGERWRASGTLVMWMTPWLIVQFLASPISMALNAVGRQRTAMILQISGLVIRVLPVVIAAKVGADFLSEVFAVTGFVFYTVYLGVLMSVIGISWARLGGIILASIPFVVVCGVAGVALKLLFIWVLSK
jgi:O-antigen/teichoic acid export membrane protein